MVEITGQLMCAALDAAPMGMVICTHRPPDHSIIYANVPFARLSGQRLEELIGRDLRLLASDERDPEGSKALQTALEQWQACRVQLQNYRKGSGAASWLELQLQPFLSDEPSGERRYLGLMRELSERERPTAPTGLSSWLREDRLSGLCSRAYFEQLLQRDWLIGLREGRPLTLLLFDIDELESYNETYGRAAGDACIRRVAGVIGASFRRGSDLVARWQGGCIVALVRNSDPDSVPAFASAVAQKVLDQHIHHPRARRQKFICVSVGAATVTPTNKRTPERLLEAAISALQKAKQGRQQRIAVAGPSEID
jgi:diguanylate cyclase (GGDEF)-like protein/PAS domain S-box-containing protein